MQQNLDTITKHSKDEIVTSIESIKEENIYCVIKNKVSIIIPTFNRKNYLQEALNSAIKQDYSNLEIIVSDNCSSDGTDEMMKNYMQIKNVKYIKNEKNLGMAGNIKNALYNHAQGEYILVLNDDDYLIDSNYISKAIKLFTNNKELSLVFANCKLFNQDTGQFSWTNYNIPQSTNGLEYFINYQIGNYVHIIGFVTSVFKRESAMFMKAFQEETISSDLFLYLKLMLVGNVGFIKDYAGVYRIHSNCLTNNSDSKYDISTIEELENLKQYAKEKYNISEEVMSNWINTKVFGYLRWRIASSKNKELEELRTIINGLKINYPYICNELLKSIP